MRAISCKPALLVVSGFQPVLFLLFRLFFFFSPPYFISFFYFFKKDVSVWQSVTRIVLRIRQATVLKGTNKSQEGNVYPDHINLKLLSHIIKSASADVSR